MTYIIMSGLQYSTKGMGFDRTSGEVFSPGSNFAQSAQQPHVIRYNPEPSVSLDLFSQYLGALRITHAKNEIDPTQWCDGTSSMKIVPSNHWTVQPVFLNLVVGNTMVGYGTKVFASKNEALKSLRSWITQEDPNKIDILDLRGLLIVKQCATDLEDESQAEFINVIQGLPALVGDSEDLSREDLIYYIKENSESIRLFISEILKDSKCSEEAADMSMDYLTQWIPIRQQEQFRTRAHTEVLQDFLGSDYISISYDSENLFEV